MTEQIEETNDILFAILQALELRGEEKKVDADVWLFSYPKDGSRASLGSGTHTIDFGQGTIEDESGTITKMSTSLDRMGKKWMESAIISVDEDVVVQFDQHDKFHMRAGAWYSARKHEFRRIRITTTVTTQVTISASTGGVTTHAMDERGGHVTDIEFGLVDGDLTSDGVQYATVVDTTTINTDVDVINVTREGHGTGQIVYIEFGLTAEFRAVASATADVTWKWQARNKDGTWVDLHSAVTEANIGLAYVSRTRQGMATVVTNLNEIPIDVRLIIQSDEVNEGRARVKSSSYVRVGYKQ